MDEFGEEYSFIKNYKWDLNDSFGYLFEDDALIKVSRKANDTITTLELVKTVVEEDKRKINFLRILKYYNAYKVDNWIHSIHFDDHGDTLYYFRMPDDNFEKTDFLFGEYEYHYEQSNLTTEQVEYFLAHRDSLRRIKGNNLPPLPEMDN